MAIHTPDSFAYDVHRGSIDIDTDTFKIMLISAAGVAAYNRATFAKRSAFTAYEVTGTGYTAGGMAVVPTLTNDTSGHKLRITIPESSWTGSTTITAGGAIVYKSRGGADTADELVCVDDFGSAISSSGVPYTVQVIYLDYPGF